MQPFTISESERRLNVESRLLAVLTSFGGEHIVAGPTMTGLIQKISDTAEQMAADGLLLPGPTPLVTVTPD